MRDLLTFLLLRPLKKFSTLIIAVVLDVHSNDTSLACFSDIRMRMALFDARFVFRGLLFLICLAFFLSQSTREIRKYFSHLTSTATRTYVEPHLHYPVISVCHKLPFKTSEFLSSRRIYVANSYTFDETFVNESFEPPLDNGKFEIQTLDTMWQVWLKWQQHDCI